MLSLLFCHYSFGYRKAQQQRQKKIDIKYLDWSGTSLGHDFQNKDRTQEWGKWRILTLSNQEITKTSCTIKHSWMIYKKLLFKQMIIASRIYWFILQTSLLAFFFHSFYLTTWYQMVFFQWPQVWTNFLFRKCALKNNMKPYQSNH